jgi:excisionase family DNA binding protein
MIRSHIRQLGHRAVRCGGQAGEWKGVTVAQSFSKARFLTVQEVADLMRVSSMTVYRLIKAGDLPAVRVGRSFRVSDADVDAYLAARYTQAG